MGLFLAASGVVGADHAAVVHSVGQFANAHGGTFGPRAGTYGDPEIAVVSRGGPHTTVLYPDGFERWDAASRHLSADLRVPVFSLHIHDGDLWMFMLFDKGELVTKFNPIPEYWEELDAETRASWGGDPQAVCHSVPGLTIDSIERYLVEWTDEVAGSGKKAYPDDEFEYGVDWQMTDFMRRIGLDFPDTVEGETGGATYELRIPITRGNV